MVVKRYQELESDLNALNRFIKQQQTIASDIMSVSLPCRYPLHPSSMSIAERYNLQEWKISSKCQKRDEEIERSRDRQAK